MKNYQIIMESVSNAVLKETELQELKEDQVLIRNDYTVVSAGTERGLTSFGGKNLIQKALEKINALGIGAQGFGGKVTALGVSCELAPTHIAGLPVAVNIQCHCVRCERTIL